MVIELLGSSSRVVVDVQQAATDALRTLGYAEAVLWGVPQNARARRLYEARGWGDTGTSRQEEVFGVTVPEQRYHRRLSPRAALALLGYYSSSRNSSL